MAYMSRSVQPKHPTKCRRVDGSLETPETIYNHTERPRYEALSVDILSLLWMIDFPTVINTFTYRHDDWTMIMNRFSA